jgi:hypothetical protein
LDHPITTNCFGEDYTQADNHLAQFARRGKQSDMFIKEPRDLEAPQTRWSMLLPPPSSARFGARPTINHEEMSQNSFWFQPSVEKGLHKEDCKDVGDV